MPASSLDRVFETSLREFIHSPSEQTALEAARQCKRFVSFHEDLSPLMRRLYQAGIHGRTTTVGAGKSFSLATLDLSKIEEYKSRRWGDFPEILIGDIYSISWGLFGVSPIPKVVIREGYWRRDFESERLTTLERSRQEEGHV